MAASKSPVGAGSAVVYHHGAAVATAKPLVPDSLVKMLKAVVFDFDLTVLRIHSFSARIEPDMIASRAWEKDFADLKAFEAVCKGLAARDVRVAIASFGRKDVITEYLKRVFGDEMDEIFPPEAICTPADVGSVDGHALPDGKNTQIGVLMKSMGIADDPRRILFFDDDRANCSKAAAIGVLSFFCPKHFTEPTWTLACTKLPAVEGMFQRPPAARAAPAPAPAPAAGDAGATESAQHGLAPSSTEDPCE
ncbi:hypothetical protein FNF29_04961 [Cafeteria roenbergensis]|nr:hypothetical protein FNF29_04961 [Cafeteria roenbergensis]KAA0156150.1 hypothetical protein FNF31_05972 [Cafeteria roenbergensis]KAA0159058.1 hypothetical protein FNF28_05995 [Cafeteria roenbergensis]|mmetsp:Transcript_4798/g.20533  ORF Transcript_4798/g.20533 Transcript_4798/m.20533 type:complete len:250 (-) Transcript_4798:2072-2821(-)|eukprot:KAA0150847.1 hypothetical protein FNF29_04961 [Cafeteria roenbergensis]